MFELNVRPSRRNLDILLADHRAIETALQVILEAARANDQETLSVVWTEFERRLTNHIEGEETLLLPAFEAQHAEEVRSVREEHEQIRTLISKLGVLTDLHAVRLDDLQALQDLLKAHAETEEKGIYQLAEQSRDLAPLQSLVRQLKASLS